MGSKIFFASLAASGSIKAYRDYYDVENRYNSIGEILGVLSGTAGAVLLINTGLDAGLSYFEGKNSIVKEELRNCLEDRYKVENILHDL